MRRRATGGANCVHPGTRERRGSAGFTLMEMLVGLTVISVAVTLFVTLYMSSMDLSRRASNRTIATRLAQETLTAITASPGAFVWQTSAGVEDTRFPIEATGDDPSKGNPVALPAALPAEPVSFRIQQDLFDRYRWEAFGKLAVGGAYYEVTVVIRYVEQGREQLVALTSALPAVAVPAEALSGVAADGEAGA